MIQVNIASERQQIQALKEENRRKNVEIRILKQDIVELNSRIQKNRIAIQEFSEILANLHRRLTVIENEFCELRVTRVSETAV